jgi:hypothetical protein
MVHRETIYSEENRNYLDRRTIFIGKKEIIETRSSGKNESIFL